LLVVGLGEEDARLWKLNWKHPRIQLCGSNPDPSLHRAAADLYLESMPFGSATALFESALVGLPVVLPYAPTFELLVTNHGLEHLVASAATEDEYIQRVVAL